MIWTHIIPKISHLSARDCSLDIRSKCYDKPFSHKHKVQSQGQGSDYSEEPSNLESTFISQNPSNSLVKIQRILLLSTKQECIPLTCKSLWRVPEPTKDITTCHSVMTHIYCVTIGIGSSVTKYTNSLSIQKKNVHMFQVSSCLKYGKISVRTLEQPEIIQQRQRIQRRT